MRRFMLPPSSRSPSRSRSRSRGSSPMHGRRSRSSISRGRTSRSRSRFSISRSRSASRSATPSRQIRIEANHSPNPESNPFPLIGGQGRKELARLIELYKVKIPSTKALSGHTSKEKLRRASFVIRRQPDKQGQKTSIADIVQDMMQGEDLVLKVKSRIIHTNRIEHIACKEPWSRTLEELDTLRAEIFKIPSCSKFELTTSAQRELSRFAMLIKFEPGDYIVKQGAIADAFFIVLEGTLRVESKQKGFISEMYPGDTFGEVGLCDENLMRRTSVISHDFAATLLRIDKPTYDRYIKIFHSKEKARREALFKEIPVLEQIQKETKNVLFTAMATKRFKIGEKLLQEGTFCTSLMFIASGHCQVMKYVYGSSLVPAIVEIGMIYSGTCIAPEAILGRTRCTYTVTALSFVEVEALDAAIYLFSDHPLLDESTQIQMRSTESDLFQQSQVQTLLRNPDRVRKWNRFKTQLADHIVYRRRKQLEADAQKFVKINHKEWVGSRATKVLEHPPEPLKKDPNVRQVPMDGRWPFSLPLVDRSPVMKRLSAMAPGTVLLKDASVI